jgi:hypothetical protein
VASPQGQLIVRNGQPKRDLIAFCQDWEKIIRICGKLWLVENLRRVGNSQSRDSDRFLAVGEVTQSDRLAIELVQRPDSSDAIVIKWPQRPTVTDPAKLTATVAAIIRVLGTAQIELAARRAARL